MYQRSRLSFSVSRPVPCRFIRATVHPKTATVERHRLDVIVAMANPDAVIRSASRTSDEAYDSYGDSTVTDSDVFVAPLKLKREMKTGGLPCGVVLFGGHWQSLPYSVCSRGAVAIPSSSSLRFIMTEDGALRANLTTFLCVPVSSCIRFVITIMRTGCALGGASIMIHSFSRRERMSQPGAA